MLNQSIMPEKISYATKLSKKDSDPHIFHPASVPGPIPVFSHPRP